MSNCSTRPLWPNNPRPALFPGQPACLPTSHLLPTQKHPPGPLSPSAWLITSWAWLHQLHQLGLADAERVEHRCSETGTGFGVRALTRGAAWCPCVGPLCVVLTRPHCYRAPRIVPSVIVLNAGFNKPQFPPPSF